MNFKKVVFQKSDKGNSVIVFDRLTYISKMEEQLGDHRNFIKVEFNQRQKADQ